MASVSMPSANPPKRVDWGRILLAVLVIAILYFGVTWSWNAVSRQVSESPIEVEPKGVPVAMRPLVGAVDNHVSFVSDGDASHATLAVFYGTDRLRATEWRGVSLFRMLFMAAAWALALVAAFIFFRQNSPGGWRKIAGVVFVTSLFGGGWLLYGVWKDGQQTAGGQVFGSDRSDLQLGVCIVSVPREDPKEPVDSPSLRGFENRTDEMDRYVLLRVQPLRADQFDHEFGTTAETSPRREALVVIHGYNNSFEEAARRAAQVAHGIGFEGIPAFYSWPSEGTTQAYTWDAQSVRNTVPHLKEFLELLANKGNLTAIHVIAHSMGNRCAVDVLRQQLSIGNCRIDRCVLAAPDLDRQEFENVYGNDLIKRVSKLTLYASANDKALLASHGVNKYIRLGDSREPILVLDGMESIDATALDTNFLGHDYFGTNPFMIRELRQVIHFRKPVEERDGMRAMKATALLKYWEFKPSK